MGLAGQLGLVDAIGGCFQVLVAGGGLGLKVASESVDAVLQVADRPTEVLALVGQLLHLRLDAVSLLHLLLEMVLGDTDRVEAELVALLEVNDEFVLPPDHFLVVLYLLLVCLDLVPLLLADLLQEVLQGSQLYIESCDFFILNPSELSEFLDFFLGVLLLLLELLHHVDERAHVVAACLLQVLVNLLGHHDLLLVLLQLYGQFLREFNDALEVLVLEALSLVDRNQVLLHLVEHQHLEVPLSLRIDV